MIHHKDFPFEPREEEAEIIHLSPRSRHHRSSKLSKLVVTLIFVGLIGLSAKALYDFGRNETAGDSGTHVIEAIPEPYKTRPEDPGGMEILHADKEIYEHLKMPIDDPIDLYAEGKQISPPRKLPSAAPTNNKLPDIIRPSKPEPKIITIGPDGKLVASTQTTIASSPGNLLTGKKIEVDKVLAKKSGPAIWLQLGTFKSEQEATKAWQEAREKNADVLNGIGIKVTKSDMGAQGVIYRLQSGPVDTEDSAKKLCSRLNERRQGCFYTITKPVE